MSSSSSASPASRNGLDAGRVVKEHETISPRRRASGDTAGEAGPSATIPEAGEGERGAVSGLPEDSELQPLASCSPTCALGPAPQRKGGMNVALSERAEAESPLQNILDTGRLRKKFKDIVQIGEGGFGKVYRGKYYIDQKIYAIKVVRLHIPKSQSGDPMQQIYRHRVYREL